MKRIETVSTKKTTKFIQLHFILLKNLHFGYGAFPRRNSTSYRH